MFHVFLLRSCCNTSVSSGEPIFFDTFVSSANEDTTLVVMSVSISDIMIRKAQGQGQYPVELQI